MFIIFLGYSRILYTQKIAFYAIISGREGAIMKFKTRLRVTFISIILLPLLLTIMAFVMIAIYLMNFSQGLSLTDIDYSMMSENFREFTNTTDQAYYVLLDQAKEDSSKLEDKEYLEHVNADVSRKSTYIIVRKGDELYYAGNEEAAQKIFEKLPAYGDDKLSDDSGYFYNELEKYVKQIDFTFRDGTPAVYSSSQRSIP